MKEYLEYEEDASRLELIVRIFYTIPIVIVLGVYGFVAGICQCLLWIFILILGKRIEGLNNVVKGYIAYSIQVIKYINVLTDERPDILPADFKVFVEE
jgi:hypothetical protein